METREIKQIKIWKLLMHATNREDWELVAISSDRQKLIDWYKEQQCDTYTEFVDGLGDYAKHFKKGTPLEWFEPVENIEQEAMDYEYGTSSEWINESEFFIIEGFHTWLG